MSGGHDGTPFDLMAVLSGHRPPPPPPAIAEAQRLLTAEVQAVHLALVEVGVASPGDPGPAACVVQLNRVCRRAPAELAQLVVSLSEIANAARLRAADQTVTTTSAAMGAGR